MRHLLVLLLACIAFTAQAKLQEDVIEVPVTVQDQYGKSVTRPVIVTVFSDDANPRPAPVIVINHGRAPDAHDRDALGRARYSEVSRFFVRNGFLVAVPTRIGYGVTGGDDVEDSGDCNRKRYPAGYLAAAQQILAVIAAVRQRPDAAQDRGVVLGQSYGGMTSITVASLNPPGVQAAINFAGGGGGNPKTRPQQPCQPMLLERLYREYGSTASIPTLWIYTENDMYLGPTYPREWHAAYAHAGAPSEFVQYPPFGDDGHGLFTRSPQTWRPKVIEFLRVRGFPMREGAAR